MFDVIFDLYAFFSWYSAYNQPHSLSSSQVMYAFTKVHPNAQRRPFSLSIYPSLSSHRPLNQVIRQQEVRNTFPNDVLVSTVRAYQLSSANLRLHQQDMQVLQQLLIGSEVLRRRGGGWKGGESELGLVSFHPESSQKSQSREDHEMVIGEVGIDKPQQR